VASVALGVPGRPAVTVVEAGARRHASRIVPMIDEALRQAGCRPADLVRIIVADGPGSFTGLRIGWAAAKGLAHERGIALWFAPSLLGIAFGAWRAAGIGAGAPVAVCYDALRGQVFAAMYAFQPHRVETLVPPALMTVAGFARVAPRRPDLVAGDGARLFAEEIYTWAGCQPVNTDGSVSAPALLALQGWEGGAVRVADAALAEPVYGRPAEAQVKWEARHGRPLPDPSRDAR
jgi:tRNA threonylcarbamoyladenosine biosynthesis protein TsaB